MGRSRPLPNWPAIFVGYLALTLLLGVGLGTTIIWIASGLEQTVTARAVTFLVSIGAAVAASYLANRR